MTAPVDVTVRTTAGLVGGRLADGVATFRGVPFAAPPVGPLRFAVPVPPEPWDDVRPCVGPGPTARQPRVTPLQPPDVPGDGILHVNVHTPSLSPGEALPVFVWIHGGGWVIGSNADPATDGTRLATKGIVVVCVQYRLGVEGFAALDGAASNRAVRDWLAALAWVQDNVAAFGGDPSRVTVGGQSAGSAAVLMLAAVPAARGLFDRVVAMSGVCWNLPDLEQAVEGAARLAARLGVAATAAAFSAVPSERVLEAQAVLAPFGGFDPGTTAQEHAVKMVTVRSWLAPYVDGDVLPHDPYPALLSGASDDRDLLIGSTLQEVDALFTMLGASLDRGEAETTLARCGVPAEQAARWFAQHDRVTPAAALGSAITNLVFRAPSLHIADARRSAPGRTFVYETTWRPATPWGAVHALDVPYLFGNIDAPHLEHAAGGPPPRSLADDLSGALVGFVVHGDPGWSSWGDDRVSMHLDLPSRAVADADRLVTEVFAEGP